jgi:hypothetical protein
VNPPTHSVTLGDWGIAGPIDFGLRPQQQGDVNSDGCVNVADLLIVRNRLGQGSCY